MPKARIKLPDSLNGLLRDEWGTIIRQGSFCQEDADIIRLYLIDKLPQIDVAEEIGISRRSINRRLPDILKRAQSVAEKLNIH